MTLLFLILVPRSYLGKNERIFERSVYCFSIFTMIIIIIIINHATTDFVTIGKLHQFYIRCLLKI